LKERDKEEGRLRRCEKKKGDEKGESEF